MSTPSKRKRRNQSVSQQSDLLISKSVTDSTARCEPHPHEFLLVCSLVWQSFLVDSGHLHAGMNALQASLCKLGRYVSFKLVP